MINDMVRVTVVAPKESTEELLDIAWELDCLHLVDIVHQDLKEIDVPEYISEEYKYRINKIEEFKTFFNSYEDDLFLTPDVKQAEFDDAIDIIFDLEDEISSWKKEISEIEEKKEIYHQYEDILTQFNEIVPELPEDSILQARGIIIRNRTSELENALNSELSKITDDMYELELHYVSADLSLGSLLYPKEYSEQIRDLLRDVNISELTLPKTITGRSLTERINNLVDQYYQIRKTEEEMKKDLQVLYNDYLKIQDYYKQLRYEVAKQNGLKKFRQSDNFSLLVAFTPIEKVDSVKSQFSETIKDVEVFVEKDSDDDAPTQMNNPRGVEQFEIFTQLLPPLASNSIDPTFFITIFFPIFYGFIVGDIAYGIIIGTIGFFVYNKYKGTDSQAISRLGWVMFVSGISSIFFGILFGEFFGNFAEKQFGFHPIWFHRGHDLMTLLFISIAIGVFHIILGLSLGVYNGWLVSHKNLMYGNLGLILIILSGGVFGGTYYFNISHPVITGSILVIGIIGIFSIVKGEGFIGIIEIVSTISNMLSYARLMALGAASVILADLANEMYFIAGGGIAGLLVAITMHILNIIIAMFSPTIHSMRLHLVEFFNKFLEYGVTKFVPFGPTTHLN